MQERFNVQNQYQQLQGRQSHKKDIGLTRWEWVTEMHRDTLNSNIQSPSRLNYFSICENVPSKVIQRRMMQQYILPVGKKSGQNQIIYYNMLSRNYLFFYEKIQQEKNLFQLLQIYTQLLRGQKENAFVKIQNFGIPQEDDLQDIVDFFIRSKNIQKRYWINDIWALAEELEEMKEQEEEQEEKQVYISNLTSDSESDKKVQSDDQSFITNSDQNDNYQQKEQSNESQSVEESYDNDQKVLLNEILNIVRLIQNNLGNNQNSSQIELLIKNLINKEGSSKINKNLKFNAQKNQYQIQQVLCFVLLNIFKKKKEQQKKFVVNRFKFLCRFQQNSINQQYDIEKLEKLDSMMKQAIYQHKLNFFLELKNIENFAEKLYSRYLDQQQNDFFFMNLEEDYLKKLDKKSFLKQIIKIKNKEIFQNRFFYQNMQIVLPISKESFNIKQLNTKHIRFYHLNEIDRIQAQAMYKQGMEIAVKVQQLDFLNFHLQQQILSKKLQKVTEALNYYSQKVSFKEPKQFVKKQKIIQKKEFKCHSK